MSEVKYSKEHEWIKVEGDIGTIGITQHAAEMLGDIVFVELPDVGSSVEKDGNAGVVESTKAASDVYTPISGEVMENNQAIVDDPGKINSDPKNDKYKVSRGVYSLPIVGNDFSPSLTDVPLVEEPAKPKHLARLLLLFQV